MLDSDEHGLLPDPDATELSGVLDLAPVEGDFEDEPMEVEGMQEGFLSPDEGIVDGCEHRLEGAHGVLPPQLSQDPGESTIEHLEETEFGSRLTGLIEEECGEEDKRFSAVAFAQENKLEQVIWDANLVLFQTLNLPPGEVERFEVADESGGGGGADGGGGGTVASSAPGGIKEERKRGGGGAGEAYAPAGTPHPRGRGWGSRQRPTCWWVEEEGSGGARGRGGALARQEAQGVDCAGGGGEPHRQVRSEDEYPWVGEGTGGRGGDPASDAVQEAQELSL